MEVCIYGGNFVPDMQAKRSEEVLSQHCKENFT